MSSDRSTVSQSALRFGAALACAGGIALTLGQPISGVSCDVGPANPPSGAVRDLDQVAADWGAYCEGSPTWTSQNVGDPSLDGSALRLSLTGGAPYSNTYFYRTLLAEPASRVFTLRLSFRLTPTTLNNEGGPSDVQAIEFAMSKYDQQLRYEVALQWRNVGNGADPGWRYWDPFHAGDRWVDLGIADRLAPEQWHALVVEGEILNGQVHYKRFVIDQRSFTLDKTTSPVNTPGDPDRLAIAVQLDGSAAQSPFSVFLDHVSFARGALVHGVNFSPYIDGQDPNFGVEISASQIQQRLTLIAPYTQWVRSFGATHGLEHIPPLARAQGLNVAAGAWIGRDLAQNASEINNLIARAQAGEVDIAIVGSEALLRNDVTEGQLIAYLNQVRQAAPPGVLVGAADTFNVLLAHPNIIAASDVVLPNIYGFWQALPLSTAICALDDSYTQLVAAAGGKPIVISETGWPSGGNAVGAAVPSPENAASYFMQFIAWARARSVPYFYFEALDETWKAAYEGPQGEHWGLWDKNGVLKPGMQPVFDQALDGVAIGMAPPTYQRYVGVRVRVSSTVDTAESTTSVACGTPRWLSVGADGDGKIELTR